MGSRIKRICQIGAQIVYQLLENFGISLVEVVRQVGVSVSAISEALDREMKDQFNLVNNVLQFFPSKPYASSIWKIGIQHSVRP